MKIAKLVLGILCIVFTLFVLLQSCTAGIYNELSANDSLSQISGYMLSIFMLAGGIVSVATRKSDGRGGSIAAMILFFIAGFCGQTDVGDFADLVLWSTWCYAVAIFHLVHICLPRKSKKTETTEVAETPQE